MATAAELQSIRDITSDAANSDEPKVKLTNQVAFHDLIYQLKKTHRANCFAPRQSGKTSFIPVLVERLKAEFQLGVTVFEAEDKDDPLQAYCTAFEQRKDLNTDESCFHNTILIIDEGSRVLSGGPQCAEFLTKVKSAMDHKKNHNFFFITLGPSPWLERDTTGTPYRPNKFSLRSVLQVEASEVHAFLKDIGVTFLDLEFCRRLVSLTSGHIGMLIACLRTLARMLESHTLCEKELDHQKKILLHNPKTVRNVLKNFGVANWNQIVAREYTNARRLDFDGWSNKEYSDEQDVQELIKAGVYHLTETDLCEWFSPLVCKWVQWCYYRLTITNRPVENKYPGPHFAHLLKEAVPHIEGEKLYQFANKSGMKKNTVELSEYAVQDIFISAITQILPLNYDVYPEATTVATSKRNRADLILYNSAPWLIEFLASDKKTSSLKDHIGKTQLGGKYDDILPLWASYDRRVIAHWLPEDTLKGITDKNYTERADYAAELESIWFGLVGEELVIKSYQPDTKQFNTDRIDINKMQGQLLHQQSELEREKRKRIQQEAIEEYERDRKKQNTGIEVIVQQEGSVDGQKYKAQDVESLKTQVKAVIRLPADKEIVFVDKEGLFLALLEDVMYYRVIG
eukprot:TRINITY_DN66485_c0_g2_i1.p1 TRINITY_DN66485_c0_g2~~TRINITY_DN66485_c0_g2_i1.p1  ORF type:complete len:627 (-),score=76.61 TRINITY_DN66485_c0_g2_i1:80-1960(-)